MIETKEALESPADIETKEALESPADDAFVVRLLPPTEAQREHLLADAANGLGLNSMCLWLPLSPAPSASWRSGFAYGWRNEYGASLPALNEQLGLGIPMSVAASPGGLTKFIKLCKSMVALTNERYVSVYRQEQAEAAEREARKQERIQDIATLLDNLDI
jgi:hypothetical protein